MFARKNLEGNVSRRSGRVDGGVALAIVSAAILLSGFNVASADESSTPAPVETAVVQSIPEISETVSGSAGFTVSGSAGLTK